ncbi:MAG: aminotransferase class V-fold PLP-dependent enzyme [bacterium]|nr:aminotransferase class V-fold PLP-dependent enzyme [bacterium]
MPQPVIDAIKAHLELEISLGGYEAADSAQKEIVSTYESVAQLIGTHAGNIAVVENATVATAQALSSIPFEAGDIVLTTRQDYVSNQLMLLNLAKRLGIRIERADDLPDGGVDPDSVNSLIQNRRPKCVLMTWIPTNSGLVQNARAIGEICAGAEVPFILDACQAVGQLPVDVESLNCDFLAATARKFLRGPRGVGFLYVSDRMLKRGACPLFPDLHGAEWLGPDSYRPVENARCFENWEFAYALLLGLGAAARYTLDVGIDRGWKRSGYLAKTVREKLSELDGIRLLDRGQVQCAIVSAEIQGRDAGDIVKALQDRGINTSTIVREHAIIDMDEKSARTALRISPHYYNTTKEIDDCIAALTEVLTRCGEVGKG